MPETSEILVGPWIGSLPDYENGEPIGLDEVAKAARELFAGIPLSRIVIGTVESDDSDREFMLAILGEWSARMFGPGDVVATLGELFRRAEEEFPGVHNSGLTLEVVDRDAGEEFFIFEREESA